MLCLQLVLMGLEWAVGGPWVGCGWATGGPCVGHGWAMGDGRKGLAKAGHKLDMCLIFVQNLSQQGIL